MSPPTTRWSSRRPASPRVPKPSSTTVRRARGRRDFDAVRRVYATWAAGQNGPLTRTGALLPGRRRRVLAAFTGVTLAVSDERDRRLRGVESRQPATTTPPPSRSPTSSPCTGDATLALWRMFGSFSTVTGNVRLTHLGPRLARLALPFTDWPVVSSQPLHAARRTTWPAPSDRPAARPSRSVSFGRRRPARARPTATGR